MPESWDPQGDHHGAILPNVKARFIGLASTSCSNQVPTLSTNTAQSGESPTFSYSRVYKGKTHKHSVVRVKVAVGGCQIGCRLRDFLLCWYLSQAAGLQTGVVVLLARPGCTSRFPRIGATCPRIGASCLRKLKLKNQKWTLFAKWNFFGPHILPFVFGL